MAVLVGDMKCTQTLLRRLLNWTDGRKYWSTMSSSSSSSVCQHGKQICTSSSLNRSMLSIICINNTWLEWWVDSDWRISSEEIPLPRKWQFRAQSPQQLNNKPIKVSIHTFITLESQYDVDEGGMEVGGRLRTLTNTQNRTQTQRWSTALGYFCICSLTTPAAGRVTIPGCCLEELVTRWEDLFY